MKKIISTILVSIFVLLSAASSVTALDMHLGYTGTITMRYKQTAEWYKDAFEFVSDYGAYLMKTTTYRIEYYTDSVDVYYRDFFGEREITRAEVATIVHRYDWHYDTHLSDRYKSSKCPAFSDVPDGKWMTPAVQWAADNGIVDGVGGDSFAPNRTITREEFATIMYRYTEFKNVECDTTADISSYPDSGEVSAWAKDAMAWAVGEGLISGKPGGLLAPQDTITRAEVALIVYRYNNNVLPHRDNKK